MIGGPTVAREGEGGANGCEEPQEPVLGHLRAGHTEALRTGPMRSATARASARKRRNVLATDLQGAAETGATDGLNAHARLETAGRPAPWYGAAKNLDPALVQPVRPASGCGAPERRASAAPPVIAGVIELHDALQRGSLRGSGDPGQARTRYSSIASWSISRPSPGRSGSFT